MMNALLNERDNKITIDTVVDKIIYYNKETGWGVFTISNNEKFPNIDSPDVKVSGNFPNVYEECSIKLVAHEITHPKYGVQLEVDTLEILEDNKSKASIINFLTRSSISGISTQNAKKIYNNFGADSIDIVMHNTKALLNISGIGEKTCEKIIKSVNKYKEKEPLIKYGTSIGIPYGILMRISNEYGVDALKIIQEDPYSLLETSETLTFSQVDDIAIKSGIKDTADVRLFACLKYVLKQESILRGSTGCKSQDLARSFLNTLKVREMNLFQYAVDKLSEAKSIIVEHSNIYLSDFYNAEYSIAKFLQYINKNKINTEKRYDPKIVDEALHSFKFTLNDQQVNAITSCLKHQFNIITGQAGTGKSSITKALVQILNKHGEEIILLSPTGKASRRLEECTNYSAKTIHRFIEAKKNTRLSEVESKIRVTSRATVIIDEASMVDVILFKKVIESCQQDTRLILVGDINQLPPVQAGNILEDIINSEKFNVCVLTDIMRQSESSNIIKYCDMVNKGETIKTHITEKDFIYRTHSSREKLLENLKKVYLKLVNAFGLQETQVISIYRKGSVGLNKLNEELKTLVNNVEPNEIFDFNIGDKVRHNKNNYDKNIFNGETGIVKDIQLASDLNSNYDEDILIVDYGNKEVPRCVYYDKSDIQELQLAFASTVHASQGSEYKAVVAVIDNEVSNILLVRKLLYTALSRAKKLCILLSTSDCVNQAIVNNFYKTRITKLYDFLIEE